LIRQEYFLPAYSKRTLIDSTGTVTSADYGKRTLVDSTGAISADWKDRILADSAVIKSADWENRLLHDSAGVPSADWEKKDTYITAAGAKISLFWDGLGEKTTSEIYQNDFSVSLATQQSFINYGSSTLNSAWWSGHTIGGVVGGGVTIGQLVVYNPSTSQWEIWDASLSKSSHIAGIVVASNTILLDGHVIVQFQDGGFTNIPIVKGLSTANVGKPIYGSETVTGEMDITAPTSSGYYVRIFGHAYYENTDENSNWIMFFRPSNDWVEL
jgi:hypothetical protein